MTSWIYEFDELVVEVKHFEDEAVIYVAKQEGDRGLKNINAHSFTFNSAYELYSFLARVSKALEGDEIDCSIIPELRALFVSVGLVPLQTEEKEEFITRKEYQMDMDALATTIDEISKKVFGGK